MWKMSASVRPSVRPFHFPVTILPSTLFRFVGLTAAMMRASPHARTYTRSLPPYVPDSLSAIERVPTATFVPDGRQMNLLYFAQKSARRENAAASIPFSASTRPVTYVDRGRFHLSGKPWVLARPRPSLWWRRRESCSAARRKICVPRTLAVIWCTAKAWSASRRYHGQDWQNVVNKCMGFNLAKRVQTGAGDRPTCCVKSRGKLTYECIRYVTRIANSADRPQDSSEQLPRVTPISRPLLRRDISRRRTK